MCRHHRAPVGWAAQGVLQKKSRISKILPGCCGPANLISSRHAQCPYLDRCCSGRRCLDLAALGEFGDLAGDHHALGLDHRQRVSGDRSDPECQLWRICAACHGGIMRGCLSVRGCDPVQYSGYRGAKVPVPVA